VTTRSAGFLLYSFPSAALTNDHKLAAIEQKKLTLSQFWRLEVQNQRGDRVDAFWRHQGKFYSVAVYQLLVAVTIFGILSHSSAYFP
jgi:hypothetical protein